MGSDPIVIDVVAFPLGELKKRFNHEIH